MASLATASRVRTPCRASSCWVSAAAHFVGSGADLDFGDRLDALVVDSRALGTSAHRPSADGGASRRERNADTSSRLIFIRRRGARARVNARSAWNVSL